MDARSRAKAYEEERKAKRAAGTGKHVAAGKKALEEIPVLKSEIKELKDQDSENRRLIAKLEADLAAAKVRDDEIKEKINDIKPAKAKGKKQTVGSIEQTLEGKTKKARVPPVKKDQITKKMIEDYQKELAAKKAKIERIETILNKQ